MNRELDYADEKEDRQVVSGLSILVSLGPSLAAYNIVGMGVDVGCSLGLATALLIGFSTYGIKAVVDKSNHYSSVMAKLGLHNKASKSRLLRELKNNAYVEISPQGMRGVDSLSKASLGNEVYSLTKSGIHQIEIPPPENTWDTSVQNIVEIYGLADADMEIAA